MLSISIFLQNQSCLCTELVSNNNINILTYTIFIHDNSSIQIHILNIFYYISGRCARAGRTGTAFSIITTDEFAYVLDLHLFLGKSLSLVKKNNDNGGKECRIGSVPLNLLEEEHCQLLNWHKDQVDLVNTFYRLDITCLCYQILLLCFYCFFLYF